MNDKPVISLIVVDDDEGRSRQYDKFVAEYNQSSFSHFHLDAVFCFDPAKAVAAIRGTRRRRLLLLDMLLSKWPPESEKSVQLTVAKVAPPTIALSMGFGSSGSTAQYFSYCSDIGETLHILHWQDFEKAYSDTAEMEKLIKTFSTYVCVVFGADRDVQRGPSEPIRVVHVTDMHIGPDTHRDRQVSQIGMALQVSGLQGDFLALTGDGIDKGDGRSYDYVRDLIVGALHNEWLVEGDEALKLPSPRVLLAPGNHDFDERIAAANFLVKDEAKPGSYRFLRADEHRRDDIWKYGLAPFLGFHQKISGWQCDVDAYPGMRLSTRFVALGVFFLELWLFEYKIAQYPALVDTKIIDKILTELSKSINENTNAGDCVVVLCHQYEPSATDNWISSALTLQLAVHAKSRSILVLSGHNHINEATPVPGCNHILRIQGGTLDEKRKADNVLSKFGVVTLHRQHSVVRGCTVDLLEYDETGWGVAEKKRKHFDLDATLGWRSSINAALPPV